MFGVKYFLLMALIVLIGTTIFAPDTNVGALKQYFGYLEHVLDTSNFRVLLEDFDVPLIDWKIGLSPAISHYCNKLTGEPTFSATRLLGLSRNNFRLPRIL